MPTVCGIDWQQWHDDIADAATPIVDSVPSEMIEDHPVIFNEEDQKLYTWNPSLNGGQGAYSKAVDGSDIEVESLTLTAFAREIRPPELVDALPNTGNYKGRLVPLTTDAKLYRWTSTTTTGTDFWTAEVAATDITGQLTNTQIASLAATKISGQLTDAQIADIAATKISGQLVNAQLANGAITISKMAADLTAVEIVSALPSTGNKLGRTVYFNGKLYRWTSTTTTGTDFWTAEVAATDIAGQLTNTQIADLAATKISGQLTNAQIADLATTKLTGQLVNAQIANGAVTVAKMASGLTGIESVSSLPSTGNFRGRTVMLQTDGKLYRWNNTATTGTTYWTAAIPAGDVTGQLTTNQIASLEAAKLAGQIVETQISDNAITSGKINAGAVVANKIAASAITTDKIATNAITADKISANAVTASQLAANSVTADKITAGAISASHIAARTITVDKLAVVSTDNLIANGNFESDGSEQPPMAWSRLTLPNASDSIRVAYGDTTWPIPRALRIRREIASAGELSVVASPVNFDNLSGWQEGTILAQPGDEFYVECLVHQARAGMTRIDIVGLKGSGDLTVEYITTGYGYSSGAGAYVDVNGSGWNKVQFVFRYYGNLPAKTFVRFFNTGRMAGDEIYVGAILLRRRNKAELIVEGSITSDKILANAITADKITAGAVTSDKILANAITSDKIVTGAITTDKLTANAVTADKILANAITSVKVAANAITADKIIAGAITTDKLAASAVTADKILAGAITAAAIAANTITGDKIAVNAITAKNLVLTDTSNIVDNGWQNGSQDGWTFYNQLSWLLKADDPYANGWEFSSNGRDQAASKRWAVSPGEVYYLEVWVYNNNLDYPTNIFVTGWNHIGASTPVGSFKVASTEVRRAYTRLSGSWLVPDGISAIAMVLQSERPSTGGLGVSWVKPIARRAYQGELIVDGAIVANKLAANAVTVGKIAANAVTADTIATNAITSVKISAGAITTVKIAASAITADEIASNAITAVKIASGQVTTDKLAANAVTADKVTANAITSAKIAAGAVTASQLAANAVTATKLFVGDTSNIVDNGWSTGSLDGWIINNQISFSLKTNNGDANGWEVGSTARDQALSQIFAVNPGEVFYAEAWVYNTAPETANLFFFGYDNINSSAPRNIYHLVGTTIKNAHTKLSGQFTVPAGINALRFVLQSDRQSGSNPTYWIKPIVRRASNGVMIADGAITADKVAANAITSDKIVAGAITAAKIAVTTLSAITANLGTVTAGTLMVGPGGITIASALSGQRILIQNGAILVYDTNDILRVRMGIW